MKLRGINFGPILGASGVQGVFGDKYLHQKLIGPLRPNFNGCTFVAKTTTLHYQKGNMPMKKDHITPKEFFPKCVKVYFREGIMLNAVGLSGPGADYLFETGRWQERTEPFFISFMSIARTTGQRILELKSFVKTFHSYLPDFKTKIGLQINKTCPNIDLDIDELIYETETDLDYASELDIPIIFKFNVLTPVTVAKQIECNKNYDGTCISNAIHFGKLPEKINWKKLFGTDISPLAQFGGGGLSGWPLLPLVEDWIKEARKTGIKKPINAGGGILCADDVNTLYNAGASSVFIGSVATLRPWRVKGIIKRAHQLFKNGD